MKILVFTFLIFASFGLYSQPQVVVTYNPATGVVTGAYDEDVDPNFVMDYQCLQVCAYDSYYEGIDYDECALDCDNVLKIDFYYFGHYSPYPGVNPLMYNGQYSQKGASEDPYVTGQGSHSFGIENSFWIDNWANRPTCFRVLAVVFYTNGTQSHKNGTICN